MVDLVTIIITRPTRVSLIRQGPLESVLLEAVEPLVFAAVICYP